ncbi:Mitochondrial pyruvate carrier [Popillia japonica]|uniref:Mitochondrial pyruvate carrier n=1 Tax=Popillia japonica TaxID=7064 RepID=A0AAW1IYS6_POPJA
MSGLYRAVIGVLDKLVPQALKPVWDHPAGPKTIFFWAPAFKWGLVLAGIGDILSRHPSQISVSQSAALAATGLIWSRYSVVIIPVNYNLLSVNVFVALTQSYQLYRAIDYQQKNPPDQK